MTMNGGSLRKAINTPFSRPKPKPVNNAAGTPSQPHPGISEAISAAIAEAASTDPTDRSMPPVRMTKVMPAPSTVLMAACWATMEMFCPLKKRPSVR